MTVPNDNSTVFDETDADRRRGILGDNALSLDLVSALAGDRPLRQAEKNRLRDLKKSRGLRIVGLIEAHRLQAEIARLASEGMEAALRSQFLVHEACSPAHQNNSHFSSRGTGWAA